MKARWREAKEIGREWLTMFGTYGYAVAGKYIIVSEIGTSGVLLWFESKRFPPLGKIASKNGTFLDRAAKISTFSLIERKIGIKKQTLKENCSLL